MIIAGNGQMIHQNIKSDFPINIAHKEYHEPGPILKKHWHEELMVFYVEKGNALIHCNSEVTPIRAGDVAVINCNDLHYIENCCDHFIESWILLDVNFLRSHKDDICQTKYITPLLLNRIRFKSKIENDSELISQIQEVLRVYEQKRPGYELWIKAAFYRILVLLMNHTIPVTDEINYRQHHQLRPVLQYIDEHFDQKITLQSLAAMANLSPHHLCRLFKSITGMPPVAYVNHLRVNTAMVLLQEQHLPISEVALAVGFNDSNYFSRMFKKYKSISPTNVPKELTKQ
ncbi:HTH-type transcriptional activator Btr [Sporomusa rhizae]|uniref:helix-turn-helix domain-containing protein n=1 Tax=Sporomusa rhizae TaxID=357999 RepID=UPI003529F050